jgi:cobalamin biosynthesis protein CobT
MVKKRMAIKTFNIDEKVHKAYSEHCKKNGISMSKQVENFIKAEVEAIASGTKPSQRIQPKQELSQEKQENPFSKFCS